MGLAKRIVAPRDVWLAGFVGLSPSNQGLDHPRPHLVFFREDVAQLADKSEAAIRSVLEVCRVFPGTRIVH